MTLHGRLRSHPRPRSASARSVWKQDHCLVCFLPPEHSDLTMLSLSVSRFLGPAGHSGSDPQLPRSCIWLSQGITYETFAYDGSRLWTLAPREEGTEGREQARNGTEQPLASGTCPGLRDVALGHLQLPGRRRNRPICTVHSEWTLEQVQRCPCLVCGHC